MRILPNYVYQFSFITSFNSLDGIYKVLRIESYESIVAEGIDLFASLYESNGLTITAFETDIATIRDKRIFKLQSVSDPNVIIFIPEHIQSTIPDVSVQQYMQLGITCNIGIHGDATEVQTLKNEIEQTIAAMIGEANSAVIYKIKDIWLTDSEYATIEANRAANVTTVSNAFTDKVALQLEVDRLRTKIIYYEDLIKSL